MGVQLVVIIENVKKVSQEELNKAFGVHVFEYKGEKDITPVWELFEWKGKVYATWNFTPRVFDGMYELFMASLEGDPLSKVDKDARMRWESLRKYLVRVREFLGNGRVYIGNDVVYFRDPDSAKRFREEFFLPPEVPEELLKEPDLNKYPELKDVKELQFLVW
jgi:hypothetical protein